MKLELSRQIFEKFQVTDIKKIRPVGADLFRTDLETTDGQT